MRTILIMLAILISVAGISFAQSNDSFWNETELEEEWEDDEFWYSIWERGIDGPTRADLDGLGYIDIPEGMLFLPKDAARDYSEGYLGNGDDPYLVGIVVDQDEEIYWVAYIMYFDDGYFSDKHMSDWNFDELLQEYKDGTEEDNKMRQEYGLETLTVLGWKEKPVYDKDNKTLRFSFEMLSDGEELINYNLYKLGRFGYFEVLFASSRFDAEKKYADVIMDKVEFHPDYSYAAYNAKTDGDKFALSGLITGTKEIIEESNTLLYVLIGGGVLVIIGIAAVVIIRRKGGGTKPKNPFNY